MTRKLAVDREVAMYKGDTFLFAGTVGECAVFKNVKPETIRYYLTPSYERKMAKRKRVRNPLRVIRLDEEGEDE